MYVIILLFLICLLDLSNATTYTINADKYNIAGTPMQFNITVNDDAYPFFYNFNLNENVTNSSLLLRDRSKISKNYIFPNDTKPGIYRLKVQVYFMFDLMKITRIYGPKYIDFEIKEKLNGTIIYNQDNLPKRALKNKYVACFNQINFQSKIDDFHNYFNKVNYSWFINGTELANIKIDQLNYTLQKEDTFNITTLFNATSIDNQTINGRNELIVNAFKPLNGLNLEGIPNISWKRNKNLEVYVNFVNGTKPFWYCYSIVSDEKYNLICDDPQITTQDFFRVSRRFSRNGTYYLKIKAGNIVTKLDKSFPISVIDFEKKSQMIIIIMPIVAFISLLSILFFGIIYHIKNKNKFITEIADFNFESDKNQIDSLSEETFFQRLTNTFKSSIRSAFKRDETRFKILDSNDDDQTEHIIDDN